MHSASVAFVFAIVTFAGSIGMAADEATKDAEIARLQARVSKLESELKMFRQEFAVLRDALRKSAANLSRPAADRKTLDIKILDGGWGNASNPDIKAVCLSAANEIWKHFPDQTIQPISIRHSGKGPMVIYGRGDSGERRVLLNVSGKYWAQFSFQFAHEFCHILCNYREANNPNLWFEESLCEAASLFALRRMAETWKTKPPYPNWKGFSTSLGAYAENRMKSPDSKELNLAKWYRQNEESLRKNATDRAKNQIVAVAILRLVEDNPQDWRAITYLNQWDKNQTLTLEAYLVDWYRRVPDQHKPFVANVGKLFEFSLGE